MSATAEQAGAPWGIAALYAIFHTVYVQRLHQLIDTGLPGFPMRGFLPAHGGRRGSGDYQAMPACAAVPGSGCSLPLESHPGRVLGQVGLLRSVRGKAITHCPEESA